MQALQKIKLTLVLLFIFLISFNDSDAENKYKQLDATQCDSLIKANEINPDFVILDVRTPSSWSAEHLEGSINRNYYDDDFEQQLDALPKHKIFLLHCQSGGRSAGAFAKMQVLDFAEVYEMQGGISSWKNSGFPTTSEPAPKLMLVSMEEYITPEGSSDTINCTITNRGNSLLAFSSVTIDDLHETSHFLDLEKQIEGAEDYSFPVYHSPDNSDEDTTKVTIESNGGLLVLNLVFKNGTIQNIDQNQTNDLVLFPNPVQDLLYIKNTEANKIDQVSVHNIIGKVVFSETFDFGVSKIDLSYLKSGVYFVHLKSANQLVSAKKIIKQ